MYSREISTPNFKHLVKTASKIVNRLSCSPSCVDHLWPITLTRVLSYRLGRVASAPGNCMRSVGFRHWWHWVTHSPRSLCSSAAGRQLRNLLTDGDDSSNQSYDPDAVECVPPHGAAVNCAGRALSVAPSTQESFTLSGDGCDSRLDHCVSSENQDFPERKEAGLKILRLKSKMSLRYLPGKW